MRGKKFLIMAICTLFALPLLPGCSEDNNEPPPPYVDPLENAWWGYFDGTFEGTRDADDMTVVFEEGESTRRIGSSSAYYRQVAIGNAEYNIRIKNTVIKHIEGEDASKRGSYIDISLSGLVPGSKYVTKSARASVKVEDLLSSTIMLIRRYTANSDPVYYVPKEDNPFRIDIIDVKWVGQEFPIVEAELDGVLYRRDAPHQDSIVIKAVYGAGYGA